VGVMNKKFGVILVVICFVSLAISVVTMSFSILALNNSKQETKEDIQYVLYLGTNDKDTNLPVFEKEKCKEEAEKILVDHFGGFTIQEANGGWKDGDIIYNEYTLVIYLSDTNLESVHKASKDLIKKFNQSSVLIQANKTTTEFYAG
jgi:hypothetical protein